MDDATCGGRCTNKCAALQPQLDALNDGTCFTDAKCASAKRGCSPSTASLLAPLHLHTSSPCHPTFHHSCPSVGETCRPLSGRTCVRHVCDEATATTSTVPCDGFCTRGTPPALQSAQLANDGRSILLQFDQEVAVADGTPRHVTSTVCLRDARPTCVVASL